MPDGTATIRPVRRDGSDDAALERICLLTAAAGQDGSSSYRNLPDLPGAWWALPYISGPATSGFILETGSGKAGYAVGTADTAAFHGWLVQEWQPLLRRRWPPGNEPTDLTGTEKRTLDLVRRRPVLPAPDIAGPFPAHLHINLLKEARGQGLGRQLLETLLRALAKDGARGVHLGVARSNTTARHFYAALGFRVVAEHPGTVLMGRTLGGHTT